MKYSFENKNPLWHTHEGWVLKTNQILLDDKIIQCYPDNDGGMWYYHPKTRQRIILQEVPV